MEHDPPDQRSVWIKSAACVLIPLANYSPPTPAGLSPLAWQLLAVYMAAVLGIILRPYPEPVVLRTAFAFTALVLGKPNDALHGFGDSTPWLVFIAFITGQRFIETGLGARIANFLIRRFAETSLRIGYVGMLTDLILAPATPSNTTHTTAKQRTKSIPTVRMERCTVRRQMNAPRSPSALGRSDLEFAQHALKFAVRCRVGGREWGDRHPLRALVGVNVALQVVDQKGLPRHAALDEA
jgi:di/tricarboxylate transporter